MVMTTPVRSMRSLLAFVHETNGPGGRKAAAAAAVSPAAGRRLHTERSHEPNRSDADAGVAADGDGNRGTEKGEPWR